MRFKRLLLEISILIYLKGLVWVINIDYSIRPTIQILLAVSVFAIITAILCLVIFWHILKLCFGEYDDWIDDNVEPIFNKINNFFNRRNIEKND